MVFVITPGPSILIAISHEVLHGKNISFFTAWGDITANFLQMIIALIGVFVFASQFENGVQWLLWCGVIYLWYMVLIKTKQLISRVNSAAAPSVEMTPVLAITEVSISSIRRQCFKEGFLVAGLNPKAIILFGAIFPQFLLRENDPLAVVPIYLFTLLFLDFVVVVIYAQLAKKMASKIKNNFHIEIVSYLLLLLVVVSVTMRNIQ
jgi:threonine/homoserine/homoserine lactone efflux protein